MGIVQGRSDGGYIGIYTPPNQSTLKFLWLFCLLEPGNSFIPTQIKFLATPLELSSISLVGLIYSSLGSDNNPDRSLLCTMYSLLIAKSFDNSFCQQNTWWYFYLLYILCTQYVLSVSHLRNHILGSFPTFP